MQPTMIDEQLRLVIATHDALSDWRTQQAYYGQHVYPLLRDRFLQQPDLHSDIELLLLPISNAHVPVFATAYWKPRAVFAIYSEYSSRFRPVIEQEIEHLALRIAVGGQVVKNIEADPTALYQAIKLAIQPHLRSGQENQHIALDVTGGTSVMSVGAAMAISLVGGRLLYIPSDPKPDEPTKRQLGTERCLPFDDPYAIFGDLKAAEGRNLFAAHDYSGATRIFDTLKQHVPLPEGLSFRYFAALATIYAAWDAFDLPTAHTGLQDLLADLDGAGWPVLHGAAKQLRFQLAALDYLRNAQVNLHDSPFAILSADLNAVLALLGSLYSNAMRREAQERYDVAALLLYRCLELMSQRRLAVHGIDADAERITLMKGYGRLESAKDQLVWLPATGATRPSLLAHIRATNEARNKSILAHGFRLIRKDEEYLPFRAVVDDIFDRFYVVEDITQRTGVSRTEWHSRFDFVTPE